MQKLLTKQEVAELIGCHPESIMRMAREGRFAKAVKLHPSSRGRVRFDEADVIRWLNERKSGDTEGHNA